MRLRQTLGGRLSRLIVLAIVLGVGFVYAQTMAGVIKFEAESGTLAGQAASMSDASSSGGAHLVFGFNNEAALYTPIAGCPEGTRTPVGQANPTIELEPLGGIWCFNLGPAQPPTRISGENSWVDGFDTGVQMTRLNDGDMDYVVFKLTDGGRGTPRKHGNFLNNNHWMSDIQDFELGGNGIRPNRSFKLETINGKKTFVVEADVAASMVDYNNEPGGAPWPDIVITTSPMSSNNPLDRAYGYGQFTGHWAFGCRLEGRVPKCAIFAPSPAEARGNCRQRSGARITEIQFWTFCGSDTFGGYGSAPAPGYPGKQLSDFMRECQSNEMDMHCRDRFRLEFTKDSLKMYVNGVLYMKDANLPADAQLPDSFINGDIYVYFMNMGTNNDRNPHPVRFHWDNLAINPKDDHGNPRPLTAAPSFCLDEPRSNCPMVFTAPNVPVPSKDKVDILDFVYGTPEIVVKAGETVTWTNKSTNGIRHTVTSVNGIFDSGSIDINGTFSYTFNTPGTYDYYCKPHPAMVGRVVVLPADAPEHHW